MRNFYKYAAAATAIATGIGYIASYVNGGPDHALGGALLGFLSVGVPSSIFSIFEYGLD